MAAVDVSVQLKPVKERLNFVESKVIGMESAVLILQKSQTTDDKIISEKKAIYEQLAHLNEQIAALNEKLRLTNQRQDNLQATISPVHLELKMQEVIDRVYKLDNDTKTYRSEVQRMKEVSFGWISHADLLKYYNSSGLTQVQIGEGAHISLPHLSRILAGSLKKEDQEVYRRIADVCVDAIVKANK